MIDRDEELLRRSKIVQKGRHTQKFKNTVKQYDHRNCNNEDYEDDMFLEFNTHEKFNVKRL